jgi:hypothetical protein
MKDPCVTWSINIALFEIRVLREAPATNKCEVTEEMRKYIKRRFISVFLPGLVIFSWVIHGSPQSLQENVGQYRFLYMLSNALFTNRLTTQ